MPKLDIQLIQKRFKELFNTQEYFMDVKMTAVYGGYHLDIIALDDYAHKHWGYTEEKHGSLSDFITAEFGEEARDFIKFLIKN